MVLKNSFTNFILEELYVIVEFCKFGNLQKYIELKRENFISQINPDTCRFDDKYPPNIDELLMGIDRYGMVYH